MEGFSWKSDLDVFDKKIDALVVEKEQLELNLEKASKVKENMRLSQLFGAVIGLAIMCSCLFLDEKVMPPVMGGALALFLCQIPLLIARVVHEEMKYNPLKERMELLRPVSLSNVESWLVKSKTCSVTKDFVSILVNKKGLNGITKADLNSLEDFTSKTKKEMFEISVKAEGRDLDGKLAKRLFKILDDHQKVKERKETALTKMKEWGGRIWKMSKITAVATLGFWVASRFGFENKLPHELIIVLGILGCITLGFLGCKNEDEKLKVRCSMDEYAPLPSGAFENVYENCEKNELLRDIWRMILAKKNISEICRADVQTAQALADEAKCMDLFDLISKEEVEGFSGEESDMTLREPEMPKVLKLS